MGKPRICNECSQPWGSPHRGWCTYEADRKLMEKVWDEAYYTGVHDESTARDLNYEFGGPRRLNPYREDLNSEYGQRMWVEDDSDDD